MHEIKCPHCNKAFTVDEAGFAAILQQVRNSEFEKEINTRIEQEKNLLDENYKKEKIIEINQLEAKHKDEIDEKQKKIDELTNKIDISLTEHELDKNKAITEKDKEIEKLKSELENQQTKNELKLKDAVAKVKTELEKCKIIIKDKDEQIAYYKDLKSKMSTKMVGETLEQHCLIQFDQLRPTAFRNAYFEKDNDSKSGSKGDFIYRDCDENGTEIISIMFEMKNECDETATKRKNENFFKELDKDRKEKNCEYAVLVSLLESENELYNTGIVDVSHRYEKMYVIRPQFFIPIITLLRNAALNSLKYKQELERIKNQNIDISNFEDNLNEFKDKFARNYRLASEKFNSAIDEIDKTIEHLEKIKKDLLSSENNLRLANNKAEEITIKKLTKNNPTMTTMFEDLSKNNQLPIS